MEFLYNQCIGVLRDCDAAKIPLTTRTEKRYGTNEEIRTSVFPRIVPLRIGYWNEAGDPRELASRCLVLQNRIASDFTLTVISRLQKP
jgi:hypothetical protein